MAGDSRMARDRWIRGGAASSTPSQTRTSCALTVAGDHDSLEARLLELARAAPRRRRASRSARPSLASAPGTARGTRRAGGAQRARRDGRRAALARRIRPARPRGPATETSGVARLPARRRRGGRAPTPGPITSIFSAAARDRSMMRPLDERAAVVDPHADRLAVLDAGDLDDRSERQLPVRRGQLRGVVDLAGGGGLALEAVVAAVPGGQPLLAPAGGRPPGRHRAGETGRERREAQAADEDAEEQAATRARGPRRVATSHPDRRRLRGRAAPASAGSSSSRTKISTCSAARPMSRSGSARRGELARESGRRRNRRRRGRAGRRARPSRRARRRRRGRGRAAARAAPGGRRRAGRPPSAGSRSPGTGASASRRRRETSGWTTRPPTTFSRRIRIASAREERLGHRDALVGGVVERALEPLRRGGHRRVERERDDVPRERADALGAHRVALVRHRGGADLRRLERLLELALVLEQAQVGGDLVRRLREAGERVDDAVVLLARVGLAGDATAAARIPRGRASARSSSSTLAESPSKRRRKEACVPVAPLAPRKRRPSRAERASCLEVHQEVRGPERRALADRRRLRRLEVRVGERRQVAVREREVAQPAQHRDEAPLDERERLAHLDQVARCR